MREPFKIVDVAHKKAIESHSNAGAAMHAYWIFAAHELRNGRKPNFEVSGIAQEELEKYLSRVCDWVQEELETVGVK